MDITLKNDNLEEYSDKEYDRINRQVSGIIRLCLAKDKKYLVTQEMRVKDLWKKLEDTYMTKSVENHLYLEKKLFRFDLQSLDVENLDEDKALLLLNSFFDIYDPLITTLFYGKDEI